MSIDCTSTPHPDRIAAVEMPPHELLVDDADRLRLRGVVVVERPAADQIDAERLEVRWR